MEEVVLKYYNSRFTWSLVVVYTSIPTNLNTGNLIFALVCRDFKWEMS